MPRRAEASTSRIATSGWRAARSAKIARLASVEPLSAKTTSQGRSQRCAARLSRVSARVAAPFRHAMMTLISVMGRSAPAAALPASAGGYSAALADGCWPRDGA